MASLTWSYRPAASKPRVTYLAGFLFFAIVAVRESLDHADHPTFIPILALLGIFLLLYISEPPLRRRFSRYPSLYFLLQFGVVQAIGLLPPHDDPWAMLYIVLGCQVVTECTGREVVFWGSLYTSGMTLTLMATLGWITGVGRAVMFLVATIALISFDMVYTQIESACQESQRLLAELQESHRKLKEYTAQAETLAAARERDRLTRELHDSVSQMIFSITLSVESTRLLLEKDPQRALEQLDRLQDLTGSALSQMRALISQWRA